MIAKVVTVTLTNGQKEEIVCFDFKVAVFNDETCMIFSKGKNEIYVVPITKLSTVPFDIKYIWCFPPGQGPLNNYGTV